MNGNESVENLAENKPIINKLSNEICEINKVPTDICLMNGKSQDENVVEKIPENDITTNELTNNSEQLSEVLNTCSKNFIPQVENTTDLIESSVAVKDNVIDSLIILSENHKLIQKDDKYMEVDGEPQPLEQQKIEDSNPKVVDIYSITINKITVDNDSHKEATDSHIETETCERIIYEWCKPKLFCSATKEFKPTKTCENFTKGCIWSPDGTCIMVPSDDFKIKIFDLPKELYSGPIPKDFNLTNYESAIHIKEGGLIYDYCWFPFMNSYTNPMTCCFLSTSQGSPVHLWDAFTGQLRATYRAYNLVDEVEAAISVRFTNSGEQIWSGFKNALRNFDTNRPGRQQNTIFLKKDFPNVSGMVSCIREHPFLPGLIAFGTYSKCIGLYKDGPLCSFKTANGVTQIEFSPCGNKLYSTVRRGSEFLCWDLRNPGTVLYSLENRQADTNQRIYFDISYSGEEIISGGTDGAVRIWRIPNENQLEEDLNPLYKIKISKDSINGVNLHKNLPVLAVSTGSRICDEEQILNRDNSLRLYWLSSR